MFLIVKTNIFQNTYTLFSMFLRGKKLTFGLTLVYSQLFKPIYFIPLKNYNIYFKNNKVQKYFIK